MPFGQNTPVDILVYINNSFLKIQVKTTQKIHNGTMEFELCRTNGFTLERRPYTKDDTDYFFLYCIENNKSYLISVEDVGKIRTLTLRIDKPHNNQIKGIRFAKDYELHKQLDSIINVA